MNYYKYITPMDIDTVTLTSGTVYYSLVNTGTKDILVNKVVLQTMSANGSGNAKCTFAFARIKGSAPTGGIAVSYTKLSTISPDINIDIRVSGTGLTTNDASIDPYFMEVALRSGSDGHLIEHTFDDEIGFTLSPTEGIIIQADGAMIANSSMHGCIEFSCRQ